MWEFEAPGGGRRFYREEVVLQRGKKVGDYLQWALVYQTFLVTILIAKPDIFVRIWGHLRTRNSTYSKPSFTNVFVTILIAKPEIFVRKKRSGILPTVSPRLPNLLVTIFIAITRTNFVRIWGIWRSFCKEEVGVFDQEQSTYTFSANELLCQFNLN